MALHVCVEATEYHHPNSAIAHRNLMVLKVTLWKYLTATFIKM